MLTPQEAETHVFPKASFGGYNMQQVDTFLDGLIGDYRTLYQENVSLKNKMKILVDKIEEYRATEDAMRMTLHSAQKMAAEMVKEGEEKKNSAIREAVSEVQRQSEAAKVILLREEESLKARLEETSRSLALENKKLEAAKVSTAEYLKKLKELYTNQVNFIGSLSEMVIEEKDEEEAPEKTPEPETKSEPESKSESEAKAEPEAEEEPEKSAEEPKPVELPEEPEDTIGDTRVFDQIQFGKENELE